MSSITIKSNLVYVYLGKQCNEMKYCKFSDHEHPINNFYVNRMPLFHYYKMIKHQIVDHYITKATN